MQFDMSKNYILEVQNLHKFYYEGAEPLHVLKGLNLKVEKNDTIAVLGPSGSGKSTLLNILGGLDRPSEGKVYINGKDIFDSSEEELAKFRNKFIGFVFQFHHLLPEFTALENVAMPLFVNNLSKKEAFDKAFEMLKEVKLETKADQRPPFLSGGERQRIAVARALITNPLLLLADEPTGNLDSKLSQELMKLIIKLNKKRNTTIILVSHDPMVLKYTKKRYKLIDGRLRSVV